MIKSKLKAIQLSLGIMRADKLIRPTIAALISGLGGGGGLLFQIAIYVPNHW